MAADNPSVKSDKNVSASVRNLQEDVTAVRDDITKLGKHALDEATVKGTASYDQAKKKFNAATGEASDAAREVRDNFKEALDESIEQRPYTTLLATLGVGFVLGMIWRR